MDLAAHLRGEGLAGLLGLQRIDGLERRVEVALAQPGADNGQVGDRALVGGGNFLQLGEAKVGLALRELPQRQRRAAAGVVGVHLRRPREVGLGVLRVAALQCGLGRQDERVGVCIGPFEQRGERFLGLRRLPGAQVDLGQQTPRDRDVGRELQCLRDEGLGLQYRTRLQLNGTGEQQRFHIVRCDAQHLLHEFLGGLVVLAQKGNLGLEVFGLGQVRQDLLQFVELGLGRGEVAAREQDVENARVRRHPVLAQRKRLTLGLQRSLGICLDEEQQIALEVQCFVGARILGDDSIDQRERRIEITLTGLQPGLHQQRRPELGGGRQRFVQRCFRLGGGALLGVSRGERHLQFGGRSRLGELDRGVVLDRALALALQHQRPHQRRQRRGLGVLEIERLAQLDLGRHRVATVEQGATEQVACYGQVRLPLQRTLELDDGGLGVLRDQIGLGRRQQLLGFLLAAASEHCCDDQSRQGQPVRSRIHGVTKPLQDTVHCLIASRCSRS